MDCHVFRRLCDELVPVLLGARVEKIHQPADDLVQIAVYGQRQKRYLLCKTGRKAPFLMLSAHKLTVGGEPPAAIMRLRKHLSERRLVDARVDWVERSLWLRVQGGPGEEGSPVWLECHLRDGLRLHLGEGTVPPDTDRALWPAEADLALCVRDDALRQTELWRDWPVLTPALRRTLAAMGTGDPDENAAERAALLSDLQWGGGDLFVYEGPEGSRELFAWPLPLSLRGNRTETVFENALKAVEEVGEREVLTQVAALRHKECAKPHRAETSRLERLLRKLDGEEVRLQGMVAQQTGALLLQAELFRFSPTVKASCVELGDPPRQLTLNPRLTVRENMEALFHQAARGRRGLAILETRRADVREAMERSLRAEGLAGTGVFGTTQAAGSSGVSGSSGKSAALRTGVTRKGPLPKNVQAFRSSDGFVLLRGRDAKGNALLLKLGSPHDLWLHTGLGAGAHVLIRRDHAAVDVPETTLREAAVLAVNKSVYQQTARADVMLAEVRYVRPMKGAKTGMVRIDRQLPSLSVSPDPDLEQHLAVV